MYRRSSRGVIRLLVFGGRLGVTRDTPPCFKARLLYYSSIQRRVYHANTKRRLQSSTGKLSEKLSMGWLQRPSLYHHPFLDTAPT